MEEQQLECLNFRLVGASSEDPEHPSFSILSSAKQQGNQGWQSVRFCTYPQEILINFPSPVRLREVNLIFHEYLIPTKVDLYVITILILNLNNIYSYLPFIQYI